VRNVERNLAALPVFGSLGGGDVLLSFEARKKCSGRRDREFFHRQVCLEVQLCLEPRRVLDIDLESTADSRGAQDFLHWQIVEDLLTELEGVDELLDWSAVLSCIAACGDV
jgi:hypothetical protein